MIDKEILEGNKSKVAYIVKQDFPGNIFGVGIEIPMLWDADFDDWRYEDCSRTYLGAYFDKYPMIFRKITDDVDWEVMPRLGSSTRDQLYEQALSDYRKVKLLTKQLKEIFQNIRASVSDYSFTAGGRRGVDVVCCYDLENILSQIESKFT
jgi:hypothetical protein